MPKRTDPTDDSLTKLNESFVVVTDSTVPPNSIYVYPGVKSVLDDEKKRLADDIWKTSPLHEVLDDHSTHRFEHERYIRRWGWDQNVTITPLTEEERANAVFHTWSSHTDPLHMDKPDPDHSAEHHTPLIVAHAWRSSSLGFVWVCHECGEQVSSSELLQVFGRYDEPSLCDLIVAKRTEGSREC